MKYEFHVDSNGNISCTSEGAKWLDEQTKPRLFKWLTDLWKKAHGKK